MAQDPQGSPPASDQVAGPSTYQPEAPTQPAAAAGPAIGINRHPVDRLGDLRDKMRALKREADAISTLILAGTIDATGDQYQAVITERPRARMNVKAAMAAIGEAIEPFVQHGTERKVVLKRR